MPASLPIGAPVLSVRVPTGVATFHSYSLHIAATSNVGDEREKEPRVAVDVKFDSSLSVTGHPSTQTQQ